MQRDLELLAAIGANDQRSLRAVALSRHVASVDHYQLLDIPRAATRAQILAAAEAMKKQYEPSTFPAVVRESVTTIQNRVEEALHTLGDAAQRQTYDKLLQQRGRNADEVQRGMTQRSIAEQNFRRARDLSASGDYYGAIVLLKQAVKFAPEHAEAWNLLGACQERNPKWRRDAAESFQRALSIDPNFVDALISLGDLYRDQGLTSRAQSCYDDVMKIAPDNQQAKSRLQALKKR
jgi:tetratricopeptide (TPR) repeat protein